MIETLNAIIYFKIFYCDKLCFDVAIFSSNSKNFFEIFRIVVNANLNTFIIFVFVLIKKVFKKDKNFFINFADEIINMWTFNLVVQSSADITSVVVFIKKKSHDVSINKIYLSTIRNNIIIMILRSFDIASAWYTRVL